VVAVRDIQDYSDPVLVAAMLKEVGMTLDQLVKQSEENDKKNPKAGEKGKELAGQLRAVLPLEPKYDAAGGFYYFERADIPKDMVFRKIAGKFCVSSRRLPPAEKK
jgi:hypothetical protein